MRKTKRKSKAAMIVRAPQAPAWQLTDAEITIVKNSIAKGASDDELKFCLTVARRYKLDPFKQQIWFVRRWDSQADNGNGGKGGFVWTPQVGINGLLFIAARDHKGEFGSVSLPEFGPMIKASDGTDAPEWAKVKVWKKGETEPTEAQAFWTEYAPADFSKAPFWKKMKRRMLAKCTTALAIRQAYPDLGGLYVPEEMDAMASQVTPEGRNILTEGDTATGSVEAAQAVAKRKIDEYNARQTSVGAKGKRTAGNASAASQPQTSGQGPQTTRVDKVSGSAPLPGDGKQDDAALLPAPPLPGLSIVKKVRLDGNRMSVNFGGIWLTCWHQSMFEYLQKAEGQLCEFVIAGKPPKIEGIKRIGVTEFHEGVPVIQNAER